MADQAIMVNAKGIHYPNWGEIYINFTVLLNLFTFRILNCIDGAIIFSRSEISPDFSKILSRIIIANRVEFRYT